MVSSVKFWQSLVVICGILSPSVDALALIPSQSFSKSSLSGQVSVNFPATPGGDRPSSTVGGGTRGLCTEPTEVPLTALVPNNQMITTTVSDPNLFWFLPKITNNVQFVELTVIDQDGNDVYSQEFALPQESGLLKLSLPKDTLKENHAYVWELAIVCDASDRSADTYTYGSIQRFSLENAPGGSTNKTALLARLRTLQAEQQSMENIKEQAQIYAQLQLWTETLNLASQLRDADPNEWQELLKSVGIKEPKILEANFVNIKLEN